jgi:hypothetical protein
MTRCGNIIKIRCSLYHFIILLLFFSDTLTYNNIPCGVISGNITFIFCVGSQMWDKVKAKVDCHTVRNRTHNFKSSCLYMSYFPSMWRKNHFVQSSYKITYIACSQIYYISFPNMHTRFESNNVCIFYLLLIFLCCICK